MYEPENLDILYMRRCMQLAAKGAGHVSPNPMVGAVIVYRNKIIGEGYHRCWGEPHAEVNAIRSVKDESLLKDSTLYVSLEPCSHYGKTPPCSRLIIDKQIPRVVVGCLDPFPSVSGRGVKMLRDAGVSVTTGVLEKECQALNRFFITSQIYGRPYILLKWARSADGFMDRIRCENDLPTRISDDVTTALVHRLRSVYDAVLVGTGTALADDPSLTVRCWCGKNPLRVLIDRELKVAPDFHLLNDGIKTLVFTERKADNTDYTEYITLPFGESVLPVLLSELHVRQIRSLLVEGGARLLESFIGSDLWDEARIETGKEIFGAGILSPEIGGVFERCEYHGDSCIEYRINRENWNIER